MFSSLFFVVVLLVRTCLGPDILPFSLDGEG